MDTRKTIVALLLAVLVSASLVVIFISLPTTPPDNGDTTDTTPPVVTITGPSADAELYGAETITFSATDENGVPWREKSPRRPNSLAKLR